MMDNYINYQKCPAHHLLTEKRKKLIQRWVSKREMYLNKTKQIKLILLGESIPASPYFYDIETDYDNNGLRYTLKKEFGKLELEDGQFLISLARKGIVLFDCALCPLHKFNKKDFPEINVSKLRRQAATHCFLTITKAEIEKYDNVPIATIFPTKMGWRKTELPNNIKNRIIGILNFTKQQ